MKGWALMDAAPARSRPSLRATIVEPARSVDVEGFLVTGRAVGGDRFAHAATRNMACCAVAGQGAGAAAALAVRSGREVRDVDIRSVQRELGRQGVRGW